MNRSISNRSLRGIDEFEKAAVTAIKTSDRNLLIHSGPGSGKTELLARKAAYLLENDALPANKKILALSFKRNSVRNLRDRVNSCIPPETSHRFEAYTFDAFAKILLDRFGNLLSEPWQLANGYTIDEELLSIPKLRDELYAAASDTAYSTAEIENLELYGFCRNHLVQKPLPAEINFSGDLSLDAGMLMWQYWLNRKPATLIFPMLNALAELLLRTNRNLKKILQTTYGYIFLDEFQDTTFDQYRLLKSAFDNSGIPVIAAGDEKQSIMLFGAESQ